MSIFFNFQIEGDRTEDVSATSNITLSSGTIIDNQSAYQVGVTRFKIPITNIPLFRVYANDYYLASGFRGAAGFRGNTLNPIRENISLSPESTFFSGQCIKTNGNGKYGVDPLNDNKAFVDINSQAEFVKLMNKALANSTVDALGSMAGNVAPNARVGHQIVSVAATNCGVGAANDGITTIGTVNVPHEASVNGGFAGVILSKIELVVKKFTSSAGSVCDFSNCNFFLEQQDHLGNIKDRWFFNKGILQGLGDFDEANGAGHSLAFGLEGGYDIEAQSQMDTILYEAHKGNTDNLRLKLYPTSTDFTGVIGKRWDNPTVGQNYTYTLKVQNTTANLNAANVQQFEFGAGDVALNMQTMSLRTIPAGLLTQGAASGGVDYLIPQFKYDEVRRQVFLSRNNIWNEFFEQIYYFNKSLAGLLSFQSYVVTETNNSNKTNFFVSSAQPKADYNGFVYSFPTQKDRLNVGTDVNGREIDEWDEYYEGQDTTFARDWLDGIVVIGNSMATQGEIVGNGQSTRKVITDFKIDPSTTRRDYLVYTPTGAIRYYPLQSTQPLREVALQFFFEDTRGKLRLITVSPKQTLSCKLEFRPNKMIYTSN